VIYSSPNNPSWIVFTEEELKIIGELATKYDVIVFEDLAYFAMDFRQDYSVPGQPPYQPTVANYTDNYVLFVSSSKVFSFAGERVGLIMVSPVLYKRSFPYLKNYFKTDKFGYSLIYGALYALSAGVNHSAQMALARMLKAVNDGEYKITQDVIEYGQRAKVMKQLFTQNGFYIVYDKDVDKPIADGFYFTVNYPGMDTNTLLEELLAYGISAISLKITGSQRDGIRACVSFVLPEMFPELEKRLQAFKQDH
jgi:aspartate/methionine/tyrosine aminotransferase